MPNFRHVLNTSAVDANKNVTKENLMSVASITISMIRKKMYTFLV